MIKISFVGDINPGGVLTFTGGVSKDVIDLLAEADLRIGTLESAIGSLKELTFSEKKMIDSSAHIIYSPESSLAILKQLNINVVSLANNHIGDLGVEGIRNTINKLRDNKISYFGAGDNITEASKPYVTTVKGKSICIFGFVKMGYKHLDIAGVDTPGVCAYNEEQVKNAINDYKKKYDYVIVCPHWGKENTLIPNKSVIDVSKSLIDQGADCVISSHTHVVQPILHYKNKIIAPSLGNFLFPDRYIDSPRVTVYPSEQQRNQKIPVTFTYPVVEELTLKKIPQLSRIGCILNCVFNEAYCNEDVRYLKLDENNFLNCCKIANTHKLALWFISVSMKYKPLYSLLSKIKSI